MAKRNVQPFFGTIKQGDHAGKINKKMECAKTITCMEGEG
jgi:hypothetical protein